MLFICCICSVIFFLIVGAVVFLPSRSGTKSGSNYYYAASRQPNDYSNLYSSGGAPTQAPPVQNVPAENPPASQNAAQPNTPPPPVSPQSQFTPPPQNRPTPPPQRQFTPPPPKPKKPKKPFSPIPLLLIAGVLFLFLGGVIFLTSTWDTLPDIARAISLLSASVIAFTFNVIAERGLKLPKTGLAFYILGCIFLPLALGGIGAFSLLGEWFSFEGDGYGLLLAVIFLCVSATSFLGQSNYKSPFLAWLGLMGIAGMWTSILLFLIRMSENGEFFSPDTSVILAAILQTVLSVGASVISELSLRRHAYGTTPLSKAWLTFLYPLHCFNLIFLLVCASDAALAASLCMLVIALLFLNERFIAGPLHLGVFGFALSLITALASFVNGDALDTDSGFFTKTVFVCAAVIFLTLSIAAIPKIKMQTRNAMTFIGLFLSVLTIPTAFIYMCIEIEKIGTYFLFLFVPLLMAGIHFAVTPKKRLPSHTLSFVICTILLYCVSMLAASAAENLLFSLLLIAAALILVVLFLLSRKLWPLVLSICSCASVALATLPHAEIWLHWICTAALLVSLVYAIIARRPLLERTCSWAALPFLLMSCALTFALFLNENVQAISLMLAILSLVYLAEYTVLRTQLHSAALRSYCLNLSVLLYFVTIFETNKMSGPELYPYLGWIVLYLLSLFVMTAGHLRRNINFTALPMLIILFTAFQKLVGMLEYAPSLSESWCLALQIICYVLFLVFFAGMGRLLLPSGFFRKEEGVFQLDWGILAAVFPIFSVASTIDWYPSILSCLLLSIYSMLFIGRVKLRFIPILLASAFGCLTLFFHNVHDPFGLLAWWYEADFKAPQILLYLLPMHLFILSLLWILPKKHAGAVHIARFCMYCFTMFCLLVASLNFGKAMDGIVLASFSFLILLVSFAVKQLRWFTLGFTVLTLMTVKLTWEFWQSLHWGVYLFLAGAALIGFAFYFELKVRKNNEKEALPKEEEPTENQAIPDASKEKINLFKEWSW